MEKEKIKKVAGVAFWYAFAVAIFLTVMHILIVEFITNSTFNYFYQFFGGSFLIVFVLLFVHHIKNFDSAYDKHDEYHDEY